MKLKVLLLFILSFPMFSGYAQMKKGKVADDNGNPIENAYIMNANYEYRKFLFGISVENLFNTKWKETQFATESRLQNESNSVEEIHFTPGIPFFIKGKLVYKF